MAEVDANKNGSCCQPQGCTDLPTPHKLATPAHQRRRLSGLQPFGPHCLTASFAQVPETQPPFDPRKTLGSHTIHPFGLIPTHKNPPGSLTLSVGGLDGNERPDGRNTLEGGRRPSVRQPDPLFARLFFARRHHPDGARRPPRDSPDSGPRRRPGRPGPVDCGSRAQPQPRLRRPHRHILWPFGPGPLLRPWPLPRPTRGSREPRTARF